MRDEAILLFGGTTEGRQLAALLAARGARVAVSVATPLGAEMLAGTPGVSVLVGRRDAAGMAASLVKAFRAALAAIEAAGVHPDVVLVGEKAALSKLL